MSLWSVAVVAFLAPTSAEFEDYRGGKCLEPVGEKLKNGYPVQLKDCVYGSRQKWLFHSDYTNGQIQLASGKRTKCLDASGMESGTQVRIWDCDGSEQQTWSYDAESKAFSIPERGVCLDLPGWDTSDSENRLWVWECNGLSSQSWVYDHTRLGLYDLYAPIVYGDSFSCLRAPWDNMDTGAFLTAENCAEFTSALSDGERWMLGGDWFPDAWDRQSYYGPIRLKADQSKCVDGQSMTEGDSVWLWECNGSSQQNWDFDPSAWRLYLPDSDPSVCLERSDSGLFVQACSDDQPSQRWIVDRQPTFDEIRACPSCGGSSAASLVV